MLPLVENVVVRGFVIGQNFAMAGKGFLLGEVTAVLLLMRLFCILPYSFFRICFQSYLCDPKFFPSRFRCWTVQSLFD